MYLAPSMYLALQRLPHDSTYGYSVLDSSQPEQYDGIALETEKNSLITLAQTTRTP